MQDYANSLLSTLSSISEHDISTVSKLIKSKLEGNHSVYLVGNGGSHANAHHIAGDFQKSLATLNFPAKVISLSSNSCYLTALSNDNDFSEVFSSLIGTVVSQDDLIIFLSGSGNSLNLVKCSQKCTLLRIDQIAVTGYSGGHLSETANLSIHLPVNNMEIAEDCQLILFHYIKQKLLSEIESDSRYIDSSPYTKYAKRVMDNNIA